MREHTLLLLRKQLIACRTVLFSLNKIYFTASTISPCFNTPPLYKVKIINKIITCSEIPLSKTLYRALQINWLVSIITLNLKEIPQKVVTQRGLLNRESKAKRKKHKDDSNIYSVRTIVYCQNRIRTNRTNVFFFLFVYIDSQSERKSFFPVIG